MIYNKYVFCHSDIYFSDIFGSSSQFLAHSYRNSWNFLRVESDKGVFPYVNEVIGVHLRMGAGYQNLVIRGLELLVPPPDFWKGRGA